MILMAKSLKGDFANLLDFRGASFRIIHTP